ncbi:MAG: PAS domain S-box protein [Parvibaculum sp.]|nr:PAS domain S-box protein [Parvibaculum sp.]
MKQKADFPASLMQDGRYRLLVEAVTNYAIYMLDPSGIVMSWNAGARRFKGYEASEIIGEHFSRFYSEEDRLAGVPQRAIDTAMRENQFGGEGWHIRKDGTRFWAHTVIDAIREPSGKLVGFTTVTRDLSEHKIAQETLRQSEEKFRILVQSVTDYAIYTLDSGGYITNWNAGAERIKGYSTEEIIGEHVSRFYTDEDRDAQQPQRGLAIAAREGRFEKEGWRVRKDGTRFWANVVIDAIRDQSGKLVGFAKITRDITERMEAQQELERAREALFQAQKMEAIGRLTGGMAHDFNNLLSAILGGLELVRRRLPEDPRVTPLLDNAIASAERGALLTQRMLTFARRKELSLEAIDLPALVNGMSALLDQSTGVSVEVKRRFPPSLPPVNCDANQLESALLNLAVNARDAMPDGGSLIIEAYTEDAAAAALGLPPGRYVCLSLRDEGEGMDEETLANATNPFFTTKEVGKGTGLGLSMVHGLMEQCGGRLVLKSRKSHGATAELWLPVAKQGSDAVKKASTSLRSKRDMFEPSPPLTVLAVDDDNLVLMNTVAMLEEQGHTVFEASSGSEALDILRREKAIDLIVTDQAMPQMTGVELITTARAEGFRMPVLLATGYTEMPPGGNSDLPKLDKPFMEHDLVRAIANAMTRGPGKDTR